MGEPRPSRAKMCDWLAEELLCMVGIMPTNPANIQLLPARARDADRRLWELSAIAAELGWYAGGGLDKAWELIQKYDTESEGSDNA